MLWVLRAPGKKPLGALRLCLSPLCNQSFILKGSKQCQLTALGFAEGRGGEMSEHVTGHGFAQGTSKQSGLISHREGQEDSASLMVSESKPSSKSKNEVCGRKFLRLGNEW